MHFVSFFPSDLLFLALCLLASLHRLSLPAFCPQFRWLESFLLAFSTGLIPAVWVLRFISPAYSFHSHSLPSTFIRLFREIQCGISLAVSENNLLWVVETYRICQFEAPIVSYGIWNSLSNLDSVLDIAPGVFRSTSSGFSTVLNHAPYCRGYTARMSSLDLLPLLQVTLPNITSPLAHVALDSDTTPSQQSHEICNSTLPRL